MRAIQKIFMIAVTAVMVLAGVQGENGTMFKTPLTRYIKGDEIVYGNIQYHPVTVHTQMYGFFPQYTPKCYNLTIADGMQLEVMSLLRQFQQLWNEPNRTSSLWSKRKRSVMEWLGLEGAANSVYNSVKISNVQASVDSLRAHSMGGGSLTLAEIIQALISEGKAIENALHLTAGAIRGIAIAADRQDSLLFNQTKCLTASLIMLQRLRDISRATENGHMSPYVFTNHTLAKIYNRNKGGVCNNTGDNTDKCKVLQCRATGAQNTIMHCTGYTSSKSSHSMGKRTSTHLRDFEGGQIVRLDYGANFTQWVMGNCVPDGDGLVTVVTRGTWHKYCQCLEWWEAPCEEKPSMAYQRFLRMARVTPVHLGVDLAGTRINLTLVISAPILDPQEGSIIQMARLPYRTGSFVIVAKQPIIHLFQPLHSTTLFEVHREECKSEGSLLACP
nr:PREDICTED: uncharacterized protein LOC106702996 [Latimeria chalumnae]|eukprot:XP_014342320.1 PREDICTED: uncharacterized protein LOC106702996 [Latimeria chalumnae]